MEQYNQESFEKRNKQMKKRKLGLRAKIIAGVMVPLVIVLITVGIFLSEK